jgi:hypothetical protein
MQIEYLIRDDDLVIGFNVKLAFPDRDLTDAQIVELGKLFRDTPTVWPASASGMVVASLSGITVIDDTQRGIDLPTT